MKKVDMKVSLMFDGDKLSMSFGALCPKQFDRVAKQLTPEQIKVVYLLKQKIVEFQEKVFPKEKENG